LAIFTTSVSRTLYFPELAKTRFVVVILAMSICQRLIWIRFTAMAS
jgi:hypothetical protein